MAYHTGYATVNGENHRDQGFTRLERTVSSSNGDVICRNRFYALFILNEFVSRCKDRSYRKTFRPKFPDFSIFFSRNFVFFQIFVFFFAKYVNANSPRLSGAVKIHNLWQNASASWYKVNKSRKSRKKLSDKKTALNYQVASTFSQPNKKSRAFMFLFPATRAHDITYLTFSWRMQMEVSMRKYCSWKYSRWELPRT